MTNDIQETTKALIDQLAAQIASPALKYIAVSIRLDTHHIDFRVAPNKPTDKTSETHEEAIERIANEDAE